MLPVYLGGIRFTSCVQGLASETRAARLPGRAGSGVAQHSMEYGWVVSVCLVAGCGSPIVLEDGGTGGGTTQGPGDDPSSDGRSVPGDPSAGVPPGPVMTTAGPDTATVGEQTDGGQTDGEPTISCTACDEGHCIIFSDAPPDDAAYCDALPANENTRVTATVRSLSTQVAASGADVSIVSALEALTNPTGATDFLGGVTDGAGELDATSMSPIEASIGIIAMARREGFFLTGTATAEPLDGIDYGPGNDVHDLWLLNIADLEQWNGWLQSDVQTSPYLPLGEQGGMVGLVRGPDGVPLSGVTVTSVQPVSEAIIRYAAPGSIIADGATSASGLFFVLNPGLGEEFLVQGPAGSAAFLALSAPGAVFVVAPILP